MVEPEAPFETKFFTKDPKVREEVARLLDNIHLFAHGALAAQIAGVVAAAKKHGLIPERGIKILEIGAGQGDVLEYLRHMVHPEDELWGFGGRENTCGDVTEKGV